MKHQNYTSSITNRHDHRYRFKLTIDDNHTKVIQVGIGSIGGIMQQLILFDQRTSSPTSIKRACNLLSRLQEEKPTTYWFRHRACLLDI